MRKIKIPMTDETRKRVSLSKYSDRDLPGELEYLRAENAFLKKSQALVQERIQRERG